MPITPLYAMSPPTISTPSQVDRCNFPRFTKKDRRLGELRDRRAGEDAKVG